MKRKARFAALALVVSLALSCCIVPAMAQEESTAAEDTVTEDTSLAESEYSENSWRYSNGEPIQQTAISTFSARATLSTTYTTWPILDEAVAYGIDVSKWQGTIDWATIKADGVVDYAIIRCGYGSNVTSYDDPYWEVNASACEELGIPYGVYIYSYATTVAEAVSEAEHVLRLVEGHTLTYPIYYDLEDDTVAALSNDEIAAIAEAFCTIIEEAGYTVGVYANLDWWTNRLTSSVFDQWQRWVAQWNTSCTCEVEYTMWQLSSTGSVNGINGAVDLNIDFGVALQSSTTAGSESESGEEAGEISSTTEETVAETTDSTELVVEVNNSGLGSLESVPSDEASDTIYTADDTSTENNDSTAETSAESPEAVEVTVLAADGGSSGDAGASSSTTAGTAEESNATDGDTNSDPASSEDGIGSGDELNEGGVDNAENSAENTGSEADAEGTTVLSAAVDEEEDSASEDDDDTFEDDDATAASSTDAPATGDAANTMVWMISLLMSATASVVIVMSYRRRTRRAKQIADIIETISHGR